MATIKVTTAKSGTGSLEEYLKQEHKTEEKLISGKDCNPQEFAKGFEITRQINNNTEGRQHYHFVQAFSPGETTPEQAHQIGCQLMEIEKFKGFQAVCITHIDKDHIHNHIVINAVSQETGKKLHQTIKDLKEIKERSNELCREHGLKEINLDQPARERLTTAEYQMKQRGEKPWKEELREEILKATYKVHSIEDLADYLKKRGVEVKIQNKDLKYKHKDQEKFCGGRQLGAVYTREALERNFELTKLISKAEEDFKSLGYDYSDTKKTLDIKDNLKIDKKINEEKLVELQKVPEYTLFEKISGGAKKSEEERKSRIEILSRRIEEGEAGIKNITSNLNGIKSLEDIEKSREKLSKDIHNLKREKESYLQERNALHREKGLSLKKERELLR